MATVEPVYASYNADEKAGADHAKAEKILCKTPPGFPTYKLINPL
jgi:hypothetical protein